MTETTNVPALVSVPAVDRSKLRNQIHAALDTARNRGFRHPDEADTGDLVDAVMGPVDEWDDALHDDLKDEVARLTAAPAAVREELAASNECDRSYMAWDPASETYCSAADVMKELIQLREMYVYTASQAAKLRAELTTARAAQPGTVTAEQRAELQTNIRFAISNPGSTHSRIDGETVPAWGSRAVMDVLDWAGLLRPVPAEALRYHNVTLEPGGYACQNCGQDSRTGTCSAEVNPNPEWIADGDAFFGTAAEAGDSTAGETRKLTVTGPDHGYYHADCPCGWRSVRSDVADVACEWSDHACTPGFASSVRDTAETTGCESISERWGHLACENDTDGHPGLCVAWHAESGKPKHWYRTASAVNDTPGSPA